MILIRYWERTLGFVDLDIEENAITEFGIICQKSWTTKGTFKKWNKEGFIKTADKRYRVTDRQIIELKEIFKGKYTSRKQTDSEWKNGTEKRATDWFYTITV